MHNLFSSEWLKLCGFGLVSAAALLAAPAQAAQYACPVPRTLLCEGCASHIAIALLANGTCRISFSPQTAEAAPVNASEPIQFTVDGPTVVAPQRRPIWRARYASVARPVSGAHCFIFNAQKYCE
jgi:hypothetical protein